MARQHLIRGQQCSLLFRNQLRLSFSTAASMRRYEDTIQNLKIGAHTRVIFQGFTGRQATINATESIAWGTNIVGGVTPGKSGNHLGLPVLPTVREAMEKLKPDATGIYVAAHQASSAIEEAIEAEVPLIVAVAEHIPIHNIMRIHSMLKSQSKSRLVGANSPGIISAGKCRIGFQPLPCFLPGRVGIVAKSGTLSYEAVASTTRSGLGQSLCIGMGGDFIAGTDFVDALEIFEHDNDTEGIVLIGEIGGSAELEAAQWITEYRKRSSNPKPISALVGGIIVARGRVMGHAGAFQLSGEPDALTKIRSLEAAGVTVVNHPSKFGEVMKKLMRDSGWVHPAAAKLRGSQRRGIHALSRDLRRPQFSSHELGSTVHKRTLYIGDIVALNLLRERGINASEHSTKQKQRMLNVRIDRSTRSPCIVAAYESQRASSWSSKSFPFDYLTGIEDCQIIAIAEHLKLTGASKNDLPNLINDLIELFMQKEAFFLRTFFVEENSTLKIVSAGFSFDDAAFKSAKRQGDIHALRNCVDEDPQELEAEKDGIVYIKLRGDGNIGTLVNGAGLAMNTVDALADAGGRAANFLDTGGKATSETVKRSFQVILQDSRVNVIFVNIFGGLTLGDMIASGIILAFKKLQIKIPVVVRIRGTNEKEGQKIIADSGLPLYAFDDFEEAVAKTVQLAREIG